MAYCGELPFGILPYCRYIDLEKNENCFLQDWKRWIQTFRNQIKKMVIALRLLKMPLFLRFLKTLREKDKIYSDDDVLEEELIKYIVLNKKR